MPSKQVVDRMKRSLQILAAMRQHKGRIAEAWKALAEPYLQKGEDVPDVELLLEILARVLEHEMVAMQAADQRHQQELGDDDEPRERRDAAAKALATSLSDTAEIAAGLFGAAILPSLHLDAAPPRDPAMLSAHGDEVATALETATLPAPRVPGARFVAADFASRIKKTHGALAAALKDVAREQREAEGTLKDKNGSMASHDKAQSRVAGVTAGFLELVGETELADRVRPPARRGRGAQEAADGTEGEQSGTEGKP